jgi:diguanylate cyclase (GGDEF)-like protein
MFAGDSQTPSHRTLSYSGAVLYGSGATLVLVSLLVEHHPATRLTLAGIALAVAFAVTAVMAAFPRAVPIPVFPFLTALGTLLISALAYADGSANSSYSILYVWVALYSFHFYSLRTALLETVWVSTAAALELWLRGGAQAPFSLWLMTTGTSVIGGLTIRQLVTDVRRLADRDDLTGLFNRRRLEEELDREMHRSERNGEPLSMLMLDLDYFKRFNDAGGHLEGDRHLREAAASWNGQLRCTDMLVRFGGEEFIVLMPSCPIDRAIAVADRLRACTPNEQTASVGAVLWDGVEPGLSLIARADSALYSAKLAGRDRTVVQLVATASRTEPARAREALSP